MDIYENDAIIKDIKAIYLNLHSYPNLKVQLLIVPINGETSKNLWIGIIRAYSCQFECFSILWV